MAQRPSPKRAQGTGPNLASMDLNLLVAFEALWVERSVTAAGRRLGLSQPATSGALARLREMLGDRLFIRGKRGLEPTDRCHELAGPLTKALVDLRNVLAGSSFDPSTTTRTFRIGAVDAAIAVSIPRIANQALKEAPHAQLQIVAINPARAVEMLDGGSLDLALSVVATPSSTVRSRPLLRVEFVAAARPGHPLTSGKVELATLQAFPRVFVTWEGLPAPPRCQVLLGSFLAVPPVLARSDAWALLPKPYADALRAERRVATFPPPAGVSHSAMQLQLLWPDAQDASPASRWLRNIILNVIRTD
jgi:DNA-binding transcriptional LysR family regulator